MSKDTQELAAYREVTFAAVVLGIFQGIVMTMAFVYAGLKLGFTLPGSTIAAIMGFALLKGVLKKGTILENNINQTVASGVNISSAGIVFTLPVLFMMMKQFDPIYVAMAAIGGSFLGVSIIIPLRKQMIDFDRLRFPSGTAVAAILKSPGAGREKAMLLGAGFLCSMTMMILMEKHIVPEYVVIPGFPDYTQTAIGLSLMNIGAGLLSGRGGLPFFFGGCVAFWLVAPAGVQFGLSHGIPQDEVTWWIYFSWIRPLGIGMLIGGALMGIVMAFPSIRSAIGSLAKASKIKTGSSNDELSIKFIIGGIICAFVILFLGSFWGIKDDTWSFYKDSIKDFDTFLSDLKEPSSPSHNLIFVHLSSDIKERATTKLDDLNNNHTSQLNSQTGKLSGSELDALEKGLQQEKRNYLRKLQRDINYDLNALMTGTVMVTSEHLKQVQMSPETMALMEQHQKQALTGVHLEELNRRIIEDSCPKTVVKQSKPDHDRTITSSRAVMIALVTTLWLALAGVIVAQCTGLTDISPLSGLSLIAVTLILTLSFYNIVAAVVLGVAVCVATAQCADMMQDLKTGYLIGGIPRKQQYVQMSIAWLGPIIAITTLYILDNGQGFGAGYDLEAPQAGALQGMINAVVGGNVPTDKYVCGGVLGAILSVLPGGGVGVLVGLAMYLPFYITIGYGFGCFINMLFTRVFGGRWTEEKIVPLAAGFIVGEAMTGLGSSLLKIMQG